MTPLKASTGSYWRDRARPIVIKAIKDCEGCDEKVVRQHLKPLYPFSYRRGWPYKVWLDEIRLQLGKPKKRKKVELQDDERRQLSLLDLLATAPV
jgi:hypothetical protein